jgi:hypothetical protein
MGDSSIWVTSSCPSFGEYNHDFMFGNCFTIAQHAQCFTFRPDSAGTQDTWLFDGATQLVGPERQLERVARHLHTRQVRTKFIGCARAVSLIDPAVFPRMAALCGGAANPDAGVDAYGLISQIVSFGGANFGIFSKKHAKTAGLWDDLVIPNINPVAAWKISTYISGAVKQLPAGCCAGYNTGLVSNTNHACRSACHPRRYAIAFNNVVLSLNCPFMDEDLFWKLIQDIGDGLAPLAAQWNAACTGGTTVATRNTMATAIRTALTNGGCNFERTAVQQWQMTPAALDDLPNAAPHTVAWSALSCDHSKLAWNANGVVCAGDLNRHAGIDNIHGGNLLRYNCPKLSFSVDDMNMI